MLVCCSLKSCVLYWPDHRRPKLTIRGVIVRFFLLLCERSATRDMGHILLPNNRIGPRETWLSPCSIWRSCVTTVSVRFEFIKVCMGTQRFCWKSQFCLYFVNKIYLLFCCVVFFFCLPAPQADLTRFLASYRSVGFQQQFTGFVFLYKQQT